MSAINLSRIGIYKHCKSMSPNNTFIAPSLQSRLQGGPQTRGGNFVKCEQIFENLLADSSVNLSLNGY